MNFRVAAYDFTALANACKLPPGPFASTRGLFNLPGGCSSAGWVSFQRVSAALACVTRFLPARWLWFAVLGLAPLAATPLPLPDHAKIEAAFRAIETKGSGAIFPDEWTAASLAVFDKLDTNHDGFVDRTELADNLLIRDVLPSLELKDKDRLTKAEFLTLRKVLFDDADIEHAGYLRFVEYELLFVLRSTGWSDPDHHARIEMSDLRTVLEQVFALLDTDHDGALSVAETAFLAPAHRDVMDPQKTGRITLAQLVNGYRFLLGADMVNANVEPRAVSLLP